SKASSRVWEPAREFRMVITNIYRYLNTHDRPHHGFLTSRRILLTGTARSTNALFQRFPRRKDSPHFGVNLFVRRCAFYPGICERLEFIAFFPAWKLRLVFLVPGESSIRPNLVNFARIFNRSTACGRPD